MRWQRSSGRCWPPSSCLPGRGTTGRTRPARGVRSTMGAAGTGATPTTAAVAEPVGRRLLHVAPFAAMTVTMMFTVAVGAASAVPLGAPIVTVTPSTGLLPGAQVAFAAAGFPPGATVEVDECELSSPPLAQLSRCTPVDGSLLLVAPDGTADGV